MAKSSFDVVCNIWKAVKIITLAIRYNLLLNLLGCKAKHAECD